MINLTMSGQYFSLGTVIFGIYAKFLIRMMLSPNSTLNVRIDFSLPEWSLDYSPSYGQICDFDGGHFECVIKRG